MKNDLWETHYEISYTNDGCLLVLYDKKLAINDLALCKYDSYLGKKIDKLVRSN